ncbi:MAG: hypothetical protein EU532_04835 [Promethearchaeota archaeon]|nr:MAG: hypothetical protein EU532_04835 [Candidatus Lokiarchaeota archaeon]
MRTNIVISDKLKGKWWEIKKEAAKLDMKIAEYLIFCHELRKKSENKKQILEILDKPLSNGAKGIDAIKATKNMWTK